MFIQNFARNPVLVNNRLSAASYRTQTLASNLAKSPNMQWKGSAPVIHLVEKVYEKGISVGQEVLEELQQFWKRSETLPKWDVVIEPT